MNRIEPHIAIIGSGRLAAFLSESFTRAGVAVQTLVSRNAFTGKVLADHLGAHFSENLQDAASADYIFLAVHDHSVAAVSNALPAGNFTLCHSAGALHIDVLEKHAKRAVAWPLQSISGDVDPTEVPLLFECNDEKAGLGLQQVFEKSGFRIHHVDSELRKRYHLAAVFANNFSNAMLAASELVTSIHELNPELLKPLIEHTFENALKKGSVHSQTGPAARGDLKSMETHLSLLQTQPELHKLYGDVSAFIAWLKQRQNH